MFPIFFVVWVFVLPADALVPTFRYRPDGSRANVFETNHWKSLRASFQALKARSHEINPRQSPNNANVSDLQAAREAAAFAYNDVSSFSLQQLERESFQEILDANTALLAPDVILGVLGVGSYSGRDDVLEYQIIQHPTLNGGGLATVTRTVVADSLVWKTPVDRGIGGIIRPGEMELNFLAKTRFLIGDDPTIRVALFNQTIRFLPGTTLIEYLYSIVPASFTGALGDAGVADAYEICSAVQVFCGETLSPFVNAFDCYDYLKRLPRQCAVTAGKAVFFLWWWFKKICFIRW
jgi:hypothetical protein